LFVHGLSVVAEEDSLLLNVAEGSVLKFVCQNCGSPVNGDSAVCLSPTSDTLVLLEADSLGLAVADDNDTGQYLLSWDLPVGSFPQRLLFCYSPFIELLASDSPAVVCDHRAVKTTVAIASDKWPAAACKWVAEHHLWISSDVLKTVTSSFVYFVPKPVSQCCVSTKSQKHLLWKLEFIAAEDELMKCFSVEVKIAYQLLLQLVTKHCLMCCCVSQEHLIKHAIFWCLDEMSVTDDWNRKSAVEYYAHALRKLHSFFFKSHFPHYFMPGVNILCNCDSSVGDFSWMEVALTDLAAVRMKAEAIQQTLTCEQSDVVSSISRHLNTLFAYSVSMSFIQLFQYLHAGACIDDVIARHCDILHHLHTSSSVSNHLHVFLKPLIAWINSSLGNMYLVEAYSASSYQGWANYAEKSEQCMLEAVAVNDIFSCMLHLIQFLLQKKRYREASSYLEKLLSSGAISSQNSIQNCLKSEAFSDQLLAMWHHASSHVDIMFSPVEVSSLLPHIGSTLSFAYCDKVGFGDSPVVVLKLEFWLRYTGALCYAHGDTARALQLLADAERSVADSILQSTCGSDRAHIAYFNILAGTLVTDGGQLFIS